jgi:Uma2 family endonuclease
LTPGYNKAMAVGAGLTIEDYEKLPDALARNHELVDGELVPVSGNTPRHNRLRDLLVHLLMPYAETLGMVITEQEFDFEGNAHAPDVSFVAGNKHHLWNWDRRVQPFTPDLAIEVVSDTDTFEKLMTKATRYRRCGTQEVWMISIKLRQAVRLSDQGQVILDENAVFAPQAIPGFSIRIGELLDKI